LTATRSPWQTYRQGASTMADNIRYLIPPNRIRNLRRKATTRDIADIRRALDLAHDLAEGRARAKLTLDRADFALQRIAVTLFAGKRR
jgi:hypothetical protein